MSFGQPLWFWGLAFLPVLIALYARNERRRGKLLQRLVAARLLERLAGTLSLRRRRLRFALFLLGFAALLVSLAEPRYGFTWEQSKRQGRDVIIAIDCSKSMLATDLAPSRLARAKLATQDLIGQLPGDRVGLIAFAGTAFLQAPLTIDYGAVLNSLAELDTDVIPRGGTNIAAAITEADAAFGKGESDNRCLIIFTDGEELESDAVATASAEKDHMHIFTVGLGSAEGSLIPIPGPDGGTVFAKDESGQIVKSRLDEERLRKIAESTGGFYLHLQNGPAEMKQLVRDGLGQMKEKDIDTRLSRRPIERYQWPLSAALVLLVSSTLIGERKRAARRVAMPVAARAPGVAAPAADRRPCEEQRPRSV
ncbi:MAG: VWA domain-containing protein [Chthoniobacter sp.]